jgi:putative membrane protein
MAAVTVAEDSAASVVGVAEAAGPAAVAVLAEGEPRALGKMMTQARTEWIEKYLSAKDIDEITKAVQSAEEGTAGDIVPMVVRRSAAVRHVPVVLSLIFTLLFVGLEVLGLGRWSLRQWLPVLEWHWGYQAGFLLILYVLAWQLAKLHPVQRLLTSDLDEMEQVEKRAQLEFYLHRLNRTKKHTAVLIFVSVMERRAVILADEGLAHRLPPETWKQIMLPMATSLQNGQWSAGFQEAIRQVGGLLKTHLPAMNGVESANELSNQIIVKE